MKRVKIIFILSALYCFIPLMTCCGVIRGDNAYISSSNNKTTIRQPIDYQGKSLILPHNSVLEFKGEGKLYNCHLVGNNAKVINPRFENVTFGGTFTNRRVVISKHTFSGIVDLWGLAECFPEAELVLDANIQAANAREKDIKIRQFHLNGNNYTVHLAGNPILRNTDINIRNVVFDCAEAKERVIYAIGGKEDIFVIIGCVFKNLNEITSICARGFNDVTIENCQILGRMNENSKRKSQFMAQVLVYECGSNVLIRNNTIKNCYGSAIEGLGFVLDENARIIVENNTIDKVTNGGIVFTGGTVSNAVVRENRISNTHYLGNQFENESESGPNSAINFHGFKNARIQNNIITDCKKSACFAFNGEQTGVKKVAKGTGLYVSNNTCSRVGAMGVMVVSDVVFTGNTFQNDISNKSGMFIMIRGARDVVFENNVIQAYKGNVKTYYPFVISDHEDIASGLIRIKDNEIRTDGNILVFVNQHFNGECRIDDNVISSSGRKDGAVSVVNNSKATVSIPKSKKIVWY